MTRRSVNVMVPSVLLALEIARALEVTVETIFRLDEVLDDGRGW